MYVPSHYENSGEFRNNYITHQITYVVTFSVLKRSTTELFNTIGTYHAVIILCKTQQRGPAMPKLSLFITGLCVFLV